MAEIEVRIKEMIIQRYGSMKKFCEIIDMPWTTLDSILKRGIANSNITNVLKIIELIKRNGYTVPETDSPYDSSIIIKDASGKLLKTTSQGKA